MIRLYHLLAALLAVVLLLAACGGQQTAENASEPTKAPAAAPTEAPADEPTEAAAPTEKPAADESTKVAETASPASDGAVAEATFAPAEEASDKVATSDGECEEGFRLFEHALGADCIPNEVDRVVAVAQQAIEVLIALEYEPVARVDLLDQFVVDAFPQFGNAIPQDLPDIGLPLNPEILLEAKPDVIIGWTQFPLPEVITDIAPVVYVDYSEDWQSNALLIGDAIGEREAVEEFLAGYEQRVEVLRDNLRNPAEIEVSLVRVLPEKFNVQVSNSLSGQIRRDVGLAIPQAQLDVADELTAENQGRVFSVSRERVDLIDGDVLLLYNAIPDPEARAENQAYIDSLADDPLFQTLDAFQNGEVYQAGPYWNGGGSILSTHAALDDLFRHVAGIDPEEVSPNPFPRR